MVVVTVFKFLCAIVLYIVVVSSLITMMVYDIEDTRVSGISIPSSFYGESIGFGDETNFETLFDGKLTASAYYKIQNSSLVFYNPFPISYEDIYIKGINPNSNGEYKITYNISNTDNSKYRIWIYKAGIIGTDSVYVEFEENKVSLRKVGGSFFFWDSEISSNSLSRPTTGNIITTYQPMTNRVTILVNEVEILSSIVSSPQVIDYYGGIGVMGNTFILYGIYTPILIQSEETPNIFEIVGSLLLWNVSEDYIPTWVNIIVIKVPIIFLALAIAFYIRGVS